MQTASTRMLKKGKLQHTIVQYFNGLLYRQCHCKFWMGCVCLHLQLFSTDAGLGGNIFYTESEAVCCHFLWIQWW